MDNSLKVTVFGLGYIGLPTAAIIASKKIQVVGIDTQQDVVDTISRGEVHIVEPDLDGLVKSVVNQGYLTASVTPETSDVYLIAVPTPFKGDHQPDLKYIDSVVKSLAPVLKADDLVILESTSPVGATEWVYDEVISLRPELADRFFMAYCPERVLPGNILYELIQNDRIVGGINPTSSKKAQAFYSKFVKGEIITTNAKTAEMCKLVENSFRDTNIAFANELSLICNEAGIDVYELIRLANHHPRVNVLSPGVGVGGHCIAVDPWFIISRFPEKAVLMRTAREVNTGKTTWVINDIFEKIASFTESNGTRPIVACMGLAFKPDIDDLRMSPALHVARELQLNGSAEFLYVEPNLTKGPDGMDLTQYEKAFEQADIVAFLVSHSEFSHLDEMTSKIELDYCRVRKR